MYRCVAAQWRTCALLCTGIVRENAIAVFPDQVFPRFNKMFSNSSHLITSPVVLQICRRHTCHSAKVYHSSNRCIFLYRTKFQSHVHVPFLSTKLTFHRLFATQQTSKSQYFHKRAGSTSQWSKANRTTVTYMAALAVAVVGLSYAAVPLYRIFCQASGYGGTVSVVDPSDKVENMEPLRERELTIR